MESLIEEALKIPEPENIARILYFLYKDEFICTSLKKKKWLFIADNRRDEIEEGYILYNRISEDLYKYFQKYQIDLEEHIIQLKKETVDIEKNEEINNLIKKVKSCETIFKKLKNYTFKHKVMREAMIFFYRNN